MKRLFFISIITLVSLGFMQNIVAMNPDEKLFEAARSGNIARARQALADGANVNAQDENNNTPLHWVAMRDDYRVPMKSYEEILQVLLENGAQGSINKQNKHGDTPLHRAAGSGNKEVVQVLLENGARESLNTKTNHGNTPLQQAINDYLSLENIDMNPEDKKPAQTDLLEVANLMIMALDNEQREEFTNQHPDLIAKIREIYY